MNTIEIKAEQYPLGKVFSNDFVFKIPLYQRPYAWDNEQAEELLDDLIAALGDSSGDIDDINPYFLGSIVLIEEEKTDYQVVDGQQRLTTLTILIAAIRHLACDEIANELTTYLYQKGGVFDGKKSVYRLTLRDKDNEFFKKYIQEGDISFLNELSDKILNDSCRHIKKNALALVEKLKSLSEMQLQRLGQFIIQRCVLVVVSTPDADSAYRIFSVMNNRGLDLSHADIFKADIIGNIPTHEQEEYSKIWEELEEKLGREAFKSLFAYMRMICGKSKQREGIIKEFYKDVNPNPKDFPQQFIQKYLTPFANALYDIQKQNFECDRYNFEINRSFYWLQNIDNSDWIPPAIYFLSKEYTNPLLLMKFFADLERLASALMIFRANLNERIERYSELLKAIEAGDDLYLPDSPLQLKQEEKENILKILDGNLYLMKKIRKYILLRLDSTLSEGEAIFKLPTINIEHVLPQNPSLDSEWMNNFTQEQRENYVHKLGNLVLLSHSKNSEAQNYDFAIKKQKYFVTKTGTSHFALTSQVLLEYEWTPEVIEKRQQKYVNQLKEIWRLS